MIEKAKVAKSAEELLEIAKANNIEMTADEAATYFAQLNPKSGELDDDDLDSVAGGACSTRDDAKSKVANLACPQCGAVGKFTHNNSYVDGHWWACRSCLAECWTEDAEGNSVMHTTGRSVL
jgi:hypothetical protein